VSALRPIWQTELVNPDFAAYARSCGGRGYRVEQPGDLAAALSEAMTGEGPALVEVVSSAQAV
jgi:thiamine pyrophosphate-dependent acetolactate synthase large subunit-like protein